MKRVFLFFTLSLIISIGCKKHSDSPPTPPQSQWTYNGTTYKVSNASYESSSNELLANDSNGNFIRVFFSTTGKPTASKHLVVLDYSEAFTNSEQCSLQVGNVYDSNPIQPLSAGKTGDKVLLTVSASGKLSASFSNISVTDGTTTKTVSGTLIEQ